MNVYLKIVSMCSSDVCEKWGNIVLFLLLLLSILGSNDSLQLLYLNSPAVYITNLHQILGEEMLLIVFFPRIWRSHEEL